MASKDKIELNGTVMESLGSDRLRVQLENDAFIVAYPSGKIRLNHIKVLPGDRVLVELSPYDLSKGRILRRM